MSEEEYPNIIKPILTCDFSSFQNLEDIKEHVQENLGIQDFRTFSLQSRFSFETLNQIQEEKKILEDPIKELNKALLEEMTKMLSNRLYPKIKRYFEDNIYYQKLIPENPSQD